MMKTESTAIIGNEKIKEVGSTYAALVDFYRAFNQQDFELMQNNWLQTEEASMSNPLGGVKRGWNEISTVYEKIFNGMANVYVEYYDYTIHESDNMFVAVGRERGYLEINNQKVDIAIRTSRTFFKSDGQWKQIHHHGSMDDADRLANYQQTVMSNA